MGIIDAYENAEFKNKISVLATLIKLSLVDGVMDENEMKIIGKVARDYGLLDPDDLQYLLKNYDKYSLEPAYNYDERIEQLYYLTKIIYADGHIDKDELKILKNAIVALGFPPKNVDIIYETAIGKIADEADLEEFTKAIKKANKL
jgi:uncharacterized tellurite resistance protein B-like protein